MALPQVGKKAPSFKLKTDDGDTVSLAQLKGQRFVLFAFPKAMTTGCTTEAIDFRDALRTFKRKKVAVYGISHDPPERLAKFKEKYDLNFPLLSDEKTTTLKKYGIWQEKKLYGRKFMGTVRTTLVIGPDGKVEHVFEKVRVKGHVDEVLDAVAGKAQTKKKKKSKKRKGR